MSAESPMVCRTKLAHVRVLEPTVIRLVPTKVRVDDVTHGADVAPTGFVAGADHQPGIVEPLGRVAEKAAKMGFLHRAERDITYRSLPWLWRARQATPAKTRLPLLRRPVMNCPHE